MLLWCHLILYRHTEHRLAKKILMAREVIIIVVLQLEVAYFIGVFAEFMALEKVYDYDVCRDLCANCNSHKDDTYRIDPFSLNIRFPCMVIHHIGSQVLTTSYRVVGVGDMNIHCIAIF